MKILSIEQINALYPDEWVFLGNPVWDGATVTAGVVLYHGRDKRLVCMEGALLRNEFETVTAIFTGKSVVQRHSGLFHAVTK